MNFTKKVLIIVLVFLVLISLTITLTGCPTKGSEELLKKAEDLIKLKEEETKKEVEEKIQKTEEEEITEDEIEKTKEEEKTEETVEFSAEPIEEEIAEEATEDETTEEKKEILTAPTVRLEIVEGPTFSQAGDNVCYYRIKAHVTGNPYPTISFNKNDSKGVWGKNIAQVNLYKSGESFTLEATATNSQDTAKDSITLSYICQKHIPILIINNTGGNLSLSLSGPANYNFNIPPGQQNIYVIPGTYNYTARGCGGAVESGTENLSRSGHEWKWWCQ
ncbi:hypothetical protein ES702_01136 [subsurface metagenome]